MTSKTSYLSTERMALILRSLVTMVLVIAISTLVAAPTNTALLALSSVLGVLLGTYLASSRVSTLGFLSLTFLSTITWRFICFISHPVLSLFNSRIFSSYALELHLNLLLLALAALTTVTFFFWRYRSWSSIEVVAGSVFSIWLMSAHRDFRLDQPKFINSLAWHSGITEISILISAALILFILTLVYLISAARCAGSKSLTNVDEAKLSDKRFFTPILIGLTAIVLLSYYLWVNFTQLAQDRTNNGVGQIRSEGISPLTFQSALGATNQPAALVRLEGDYAANPFSPMLYLREQALSDFNGYEMVLATKNFDQDIPGVSPIENFIGEEPLDLDPRVPVKQSIYLLAEHKLAFGLDLPLSIKPFKNPNPSKFKGAYSVYSIAPTYKLSELAGSSVGDPSWSEETRNHYTRKHPDPRYLQLAKKIIGEIPESIQRATTLVDFFNKNAIYTLTPNHPNDSGQDPVAQFLFGDLRGYCVHFAHAMTYLLRAIDIPARVTTGYLTDLSQAKDGHILLRMSDRHAWSEIYIQGKGWIPFDIQPEQVESHGESPVDLKLLEELMSSLESPEDELPKSETLNEVGLREDKTLKDLLPDLRTVLIAIIILLVVPILIKLFILTEWRFRAEPTLKLLRYYRAATLHLHDLGYIRDFGETRMQFADRVSRELGTPVLISTPTVNLLRYGVVATSDKSSQAAKALESELDATRNADRSIPFGRRILAIFSLRSVITFILRGRW